MMSSQIRWVTRPVSSNRSNAYGVLSAGKKVGSVSTWKCRCGTVELPLVPIPDLRRDRPGVHVGVQQVLPGADLDDDVVADRVVDARDGRRLGQLVVVRQAVQGRDDRAACGGEDRLVVRHVARELRRV